MGSSEQRLHLLAAWREAPLPERGAPDDDHAELERAFEPVEIVAINGWNRLALALRTPAGEYVSPHQAAPAGVG